MNRLIVFNAVTVDGYFVGPNGDMNWAHDKNDAEWTKFTENNAKGDCVLVFGRITYEIMSSWWPTPKAKDAMPVVADAMNRLPKVVFSRTLDQVSWNNTKLMKGDLVTEIQKLKKTSERDLMIFGSGTLVSELTQAGLIDEYQIVLHPTVLGHGRTMFEGVARKLDLKRTDVRTFANGIILSHYESKT
ncbi:MAG: dihydrofolate reductase family protein [Opitutaceae bacterium]